MSKKLSEKRHTTRVMCLDQLTNKAYLSFKSSENAHDILKLDLTSTNQTDTVSAHTGLIRDIQYCDDLILSTSTDKTLQLISVKTNKVEQSILLPMPGWTCQFDTMDSTKLYCGLGNSSIFIYDTRNPNHVLQKLESANIQKSPLHSMFFRKVNDQLALFCSNLTQSFVWDMSQYDANCKILDTGVKG